MISTDGKSSSSVLQIHCSKSIIVFKYSLRDVMLCNNSYSSCLEMWSKFTYSVFLFTVKVAFLKLIWHFQKTTLSGHLKWNLSQIFGTLMVGTVGAHWMILPLFVARPVRSSILDMFRSFITKEDRHAIHEIECKLKANSMLRHEVINLRYR